MNETEKRDRRDEKEEIRYHVIFYGQVQGVGFRYRAYYAAYQLGLTGWVRNCWDETAVLCRFSILFSIRLSFRHGSRNTSLPLQDPRRLPLQEYES